MQHLVKLTSKGGMLLVLYAFIVYGVDYKDQLWIIDKSFISPLSNPFIILKPYQLLLTVEFIVE
ncbi:hypothetical protein BB560_000015 [Smittium megazygosporum]|uniref:Uncharacterized protein n=1 Tax=Smittium megazygosporum TaxID=133381 RepID=A0A2T9ZLJ3_9FUNG|nr:hypothetical protein BB560_000015 [Smittium megazygosporum]